MPDSYRNLNVLSRIITAREWLADGEDIEADAVLRDLEDELTRREPAGDEQRAWWVRDVDRETAAYLGRQAAEAVGHFLREGRPGPSRFVPPADLETAA